ncbi:EAL domain-containing protein [Aneurinibacillus sp. Ricciae_BoGa-3]|uniref:putative bifunctional diguanylate cyclase/phosphodiesterase n=1 Tax=Aneurinibacillus sp. Ricciae_BoGa-3 TaxID=3022697 RepID=UPI00234200B1|nr:EAL domain-containing protein [Aneurinibacillus sp. Ricciae_BoGa-3]WCK53024.1 EAL domain-containing protein [Aneurinibacillus sp. Ricciae_BoGa-3]
MDNNRTKRVKSCVFRQRNMALKSVMNKLLDITHALDESSIVAITDQAGVIQYVNKKFCEISGFSYEELIGQSHRIIKSGYHEPEFFQEMWQTISQGEIWKGEIKNRAKDGSIYWVQTTIVPFLDESRHPYQYISIRNEITERKKIEEKINFIAYHDSLTGLPNRRAFTDQLSQAFLEHKQPSVMFMDLDRFSMLNDSLGHIFGDRLLQAVAKRFRQFAAKDQIAARLDGDKFALLLPDAQKIEVEQKALEIIHTFKKPFVIDEYDLHITPLIGIVLADDTDETELLLKKADTALFHAKEQQSPYVFYTSDMNNSAFDKLLLENSLRKGLQRGEFVLFYQPQIDIHTRVIVGTEALIRWKHPERGFISPAAFIPLAEETGLIEEIGEWVLLTACRQNKQWQDAGYPPMRMAVNLSSRQFRKGNLVETVDRILKETKLDPQHLELEITESMMMNVEPAIETLYRLRRLGVQISMDDFGTGYSSLNYLKKFPINRLKIDQSFVRDIHQGTKDSAIVTTIITMAHNLKLNVIAEGVETEEQLSFLKSQYCKEAQGYLFTPPLPAEQIEERMHSFKSPAQ